MPTEIAVGFDDMTVLSEDDLELFILNLDEDPELPPFYVDVAGRRFAYSSTTFPVKGHGATMPPFVREQERAGNLVILVERNGRYMAYVHDPNAVYDDEEDEEEAEESA
jgi:hypothetical protein